MAWMDSRKADGTLKRCVNLKLCPVTVCDELRGDQILFVPDCAARSFEWSAMDRKDMGPTGLGKRMELEILVRSLHLNLIACPRNCVSYENEWEARFYQALSILWGARKYLAAPFQWFAKLPGQTQLLIIALLILALVPRWVPPLISLIQTVHGK